MNKTILATIILLADIHEEFIPPGEGTHGKQETHARAMQVLSTMDIEHVEQDTITQAMTQAGEIMDTILAMESENPYIAQVQQAILGDEPNPPLMGSAFLMAQKLGAKQALADYSSPTGEYFGTVGETWKGEVNGIVESCKPYHGDHGPINFNRLILETGETLVWHTGTWAGAVGEIVTITSMRIKAHEFDDFLSRQISRVTHVKFKEA